MSILGFLLKSKKEMSKKSTKPIKVGKYKVSSHAQNRIVQGDRNLTKWGLVDNLFTKPNAISKIKGDKPFRSYNRIGKTMTTSINPDTNVVSTARRVSKKEMKEYGLIRRNNKYVKKNKK